MPLSASIVKSKGGQKQSVLYGQNTLMFICARLRHVATIIWEVRRYMNIGHLFKSEEDLLSDIIAG